MRRSQDANLASTISTATADASVQVVDAEVTLAPTATTEVESVPEAVVVTVDGVAGTPSPAATLGPTPTPVAGKPVVIAGTYATPVEPPVTAIPPRATAIPVPPGVVNIMLLGSDIRPDDAGYRTDTIIVVSINTNEGTVSMLSLPRDLFVYVPGWTMSRINTADSRGAAVGWPGGGPGLLRETLLYNFGIQTHHYARVDFNGFTEIVDTLGGVDVPVDCAFQDWIPVDFSLTEEELEDPDKWELHTLDVGVHHLDGDMALWYARARIRTSDYDRARRQQQILRAIWGRSTSLGWLEPGPESVRRISQLWTTGNEIIETDMGLGNILQLVPIASDLDTSRIRSYFIGPAEIIGWRTPDGSQVSLPNPEAVENIVSLALQPPAANFVAANTATVEVRNGTSIDRLDEVGADRLGWEGQIAIPTGDSDAPANNLTVIYDFKGTSKGSQVYELQRILGVPFDRVVVQPDPNRSVDYLVVLGDDFTARSCSPERYVPPPVTVTPPASTGG